MFVTESGMIIDSIFEWRKQPSLIDVTVSGIVNEVKPELGAQYTMVVLSLVYTTNVSLQNFSLLFET